jgi:hypothetical protein
MMASSSSSNAVTVPYSKRCRSVTCCGNNAGGQQKRKHAESIARARTATQLRDT